MMDGTWKEGWLHGYVVGGQDIEKGRILPTCPMPRNAFVRVKHQNNREGKGKARIGDSCSSLVLFEA